MPESNSITGSLRSLISERLFPLKECFTDQCDLYAEGLDSMAMMQLILLLEQELAVRIEAEDLGKENFQTLGALARLVEKKRSS
ncbi:MAG: hypothetical protein H7A51_16955 [Akkermansiaceae bacterium]|nr:hypothetical protein [Akkermansiaceae bacterium]